MSLAAVMEPLRGANRVSGRKLFEWRLLSADGAPPVSSSGVPFPVHGLFDGAQVGDLLIVVGAFDVERQAGRIASGLRHAARHGTVLCGVEGGSWALAKAGLLDGRKATTHWEDLEEFAGRFPAIEVVPDRYVMEGGRWTTGGATPALDMMIELMRRRHGMGLALDVASLFIYDQRHSPTDPQPVISVGQLASADPVLVRAIRIMEEHLENPVPISFIAKRAGVTARTLQSRFRVSFSRSPQEYYLGLRLNTARRRLMNTRQPVSAIALSCGFGNPTSFSRAFKRHFGISPKEMRNP